MGPGAISESSRLPPTLIVSGSVVSSANPATFCLGEPAKNLDTESINDFEAPVSPPQPEKLYVRLHYSGNLALADVITLTRTAARFLDQTQILPVLTRL